MTVDVDVDDRAALEVEGLSYEYRRGAPVFRDVSLRLGAGEVLCILGPNGVGKSTLLGCMARFLTPTAGRVRVCGRDIAGLRQAELARHVAFVAQMQTSSFGYTVRDYAVMGRAPHVGLLSMPGKQAYELVDRALDELGIAYLAEKPFNEISGGERQQVEIARVIVQDARVVLLDEPANHLDLGNQVKVLRALSGLADQGRTVVLTTHNPDHCTMLGGRVAIMRRGEPVEVGAIQDVLDGGRLSGLYGTGVAMEWSARAGRDVCYPLGWRAGGSDDAGSMGGLAGAGGPIGVGDGLDGGAGEGRRA